MFYCRLYLVEPVLKLFLFQSLCLLQWWSLFCLECVLYQRTIPHLCNAYIDTHLSASILLHRTITICEQWMIRNIFNDIWKFRGWMGGCATMWRHKIVRPNKVHYSCWHDVLQFEQRAWHIKYTYYSIIMNAGCLVNCQARLSLLSEEKSIPERNMQTIYELKIMLIMVKGKLDRYTHGNNHTHWTRIHTPFSPTLN